MLTIRAEQMTVLDAHVRRRFVEELRAVLAEKYPQCLPSFPLPAQERIVGNMLDRAGRWGITWKIALAAFADTMLAVAPNFDENPEVRAALRVEWLDRDRAMLSLRRRVPPAAWAAAEAGAQDLPLYVPADQSDAPLLDRTAATIALALGDVLGGADPRPLAAMSLKIARQRGLGEIPDAPLVIAARRLLYAESQRRTPPPWEEDVFDRGDRSAGEKVAMLKLRIGLDHGRFI